MSRFEFKLPDIGEGIAEAELVEWLVEVGDTIAEDQQIAAVMTDKATVELESPVAGKITERSGAIGDVMSVGSMLVAIETEGEVPEEVLEANEGAGEDAPAEAAPAPPPPPSPAPSPAPSAPAPKPSPAPAAASTPAPPPPDGKVLASPVVRRRARDLGIALAEVPHEGRRVKNAELDAYLIAAEQRETGAPAPTRRPLKDEDIPVVGMRRMIAQKMAESKSEIPHFTYVEEIDMTEFERLRAELGASGRKMSLLPMLGAAICRILPDFPQFNAHYYKDAGHIRRFGAVHLGIATQADSGLMVPVVRDAERMDVFTLNEAIAARVEEAREGRIDRENLRGSTLTITSLGKLGGIAATPIINAPEVCIIGPNKIEMRPVWQDGEFVPRKMMNLSISCDHRIVDGYDAASFVAALKRRLEMPALIFVDG